MEFKELSWHARGRLWLRLLIRFSLAALFLLLFVKVGLPLLSFFMPFVLAFILTWLFEPLVRFLIRKTILNRKAVSIIVILLICGLLGGLLSWFVYKIFIEIVALSNNWTDIWESISSAVSSLSTYTEKFVGYLPTPVQDFLYSVSGQVINWAQELGTSSIIPKTTSFAVAIPSVVIAMVFFLLGTYFMMADYPRISQVVTNWMPINLKAFLRFLAKTFQTAFGGYLRAELLLSLVVFFILVIGFALMGLPYGLLLAFIFAVLDFIPIIGAGTVMVPWAVVCIALGDWKTAISLLAIWLVVATFRRIAEPRFLGVHTGLHPLLALISIFIGMKSFGILGMVLAPTLLLVFLNACYSGVLDGLVIDLSLAFQDVSAFLKHDRDKGAS